MQLQTIQAKIMKATLTTTTDTFNTSKKLPMPLILTTASFLPKKTMLTEGN